MSACQSQNLPGPLEQAEAVYRDFAAQLPPVTGAMIARRAGHFAAEVRLVLDEPEAARRLREATSGLRDASSLNTLLPRVLDGAMSLMGADLGNIRLLDPVAGSLRIVTQSGFDSGIPDHFAVVDDGRSAGGRARQRPQTVIADITADPALVLYQGIAALWGIRAIQSTPLVDYAGRLVGLVTTHFRRPYRPAPLDLRIMVLYADFAGEAIAAHLGALGGGRPGDLGGQAIISALLDPGDGQGGGGTAAAAPGAGPGSRERGTASELAAREDRLSWFGEHLVNRLFAVGMSLDSARSIVGRGAAVDRIAAATAEVDRLIGDIRSFMFMLAADHENHAPDPQPLPPGGYSGRTGQLLTRVVNSIFEAGMLLESAADLPHDAAKLDIAEALQRLDDLVQDVRDHVFSEPGHGTRPGPAGRSPSRSLERSAQTSGHSQLLQRRMAQTARTLQVSAVDAAALLERRGELLGPPGRIDYPTEIKRWRAFAAQAEQIARRWEQLL